MTDRTTGRLTDLPRSPRKLTDVTTRLGFAIIGIGILLLIVRAINWVDSETADILATLAIVVGALAVAVDGESADRDG